MQDFPLTLPHFFARAERMFAGKEVVTGTVAGPERLAYGTWAERSRRLGGVLDMLGVGSGGRVGTFAWNSSRHLELYFAVPCTGRVLHTINVLMTPEQHGHVVNDAEDEVIFVDRALIPLLYGRIDRFAAVRHVVVMGAGPDDLPEPASGPEVHDYETLLAGAKPVDFVVDDEYLAAAICHTSGTTGNPKGIVYSHRSMFLHTFGVMHALDIQERDRILPAVPMFHVNAWGLAHAAVATGASLVLPGPELSPGAFAGLIETERVTVAAGVPSTWMSVLPEIIHRDTSGLRLILSGGSAVPTELSDAYRSNLGLRITQAWGMTETSPLGTILPRLSILDDEPAPGDCFESRTNVGKPVIGVEMRIVHPDQDGSMNTLPWDGATPGELQVRGPWIAAAYHGDPDSFDHFTDDGWLRTGDIVTMDPSGNVRVVDRSKDVIKSGGEWISSVTLENELMAHPRVAEAAVIGISDYTWGERPLACVVLRPGVTADIVTKFTLLAFLEERVPGWWLPEDIVFTDHIPKTSVGKFSKRELRSAMDRGMDTP
jgi:fatty-acyl-CoA synthase